MAYRLEHDHDSCIGCGACVAICPKYWKIEGAKAKLIKAQCEDKDLKCNRQAAESCPVNAIHIYKDNKKMI